MALAQPGYAWRPSTFMFIVVHWASADVAVCGQTVDPEGRETVESIRCPECNLWLRQCGPKERR